MSKPHTAERTQDAGHKGFQSREHKAIWKVVRAAYKLCDDTANGGVEGMEPEVPAESWEDLAAALEALEDLIPDSAGPCDVSYAVTLFWPALFASATPPDVRTECDWPSGEFWFKDEPGEHDPCYVVMPGGAMLPINHHAGPGVDIARAKFIIAACNRALLASAPHPVHAGAVEGWQAGIEDAAKLCDEHKEARRKDASDAADIDQPHTASDAWDYAADEAEILATRIRALSPPAVSTPKTGDAS